MGKTPYTLKLAKTSQIQGIPGFLDAWIPGFKNPKMLPKALKIIMIMLQGSFSLKFYQKQLFFEKLLNLLVNPVAGKRQSQ